MRGAAFLLAWLIASSRLGDQCLLFSISSSLLFKTTQGEHGTSLNYRYTQALIFLCTKMKVV